MPTSWNGVFPAVTTQLNPDQSLNLPATARHIEALIQSRISGLIVCGSLGENQTLAPDEKRQVVRLAVETAADRLPVLSGVAESSTRAAVEYVHDVKQLGADGVMLMPAMSYRGDPRESMAHLRAVADAVDLPIMIYNNPVSYVNDITPAMFAELASHPRFVAIKESAGDPRRITEIRRQCGDRYQLFTGVDDLILESAILGIDGWVAGSGIAFPAENQRFWELTRRGEWDAARELYRWFTPLLRLDVHVKFVQYIKLAVQECGLGAEWVRAPRQTLEGSEREQVLDIIRAGIATRPAIQESAG